MVHPDHETRVGAHRIFSVVLVPTSVFPRQCLAVSDPKALGIPRTLSRAVSVFSSSAALFDKLKQEKRFSSENQSQYNQENVVGEVLPANGDEGMLNRLNSTYNQVSSGNSTLQPNAADEITTNNFDRDLVSLAMMIIH